MEYLKENFDLSVIYVRSDGSYLVNRGLYHIPNEGEWAELWEQVNVYAKEHPKVVYTEPTPEEQAALEFEKLTPEEQKAVLLAKAKIERAAAVAAITVEVDGMLFDGDEKAQERMARAVSMADSLDEESEWVLHDSTVAIVTAAQLRQACRKAGKMQTALWIKPYVDTNVVATNTEQHYTLK